MAATRADKFVGIPGAVAMVAVGTGVSVGGMGVLVAVDTGVLVADGTGVSVGGTGVWVGGTGVAVGSCCCCCCTMRKSPGLTLTETKLRSIAQHACANRLDSISVPLVVFTHVGVKVRRVVIAGIFHMNEQLVFALSVGRRRKIW